MPSDTWKPYIMGNSAAADYVNDSTTLTMSYTMASESNTLLVAVAEMGIIDGAAVGGPLVDTITFAGQALVGTGNTSTRPGTDLYWISNPTTKAGTITVVTDAPDEGTTNYMVWATAVDIANAKKDPPVSIWRHYTNAADGTSVTAYVDDTPERDEVAWSPVGLSVGVIVCQGLGGFSGAGSGINIAMSYTHDDSVSALLDCSMVVAYGYGKSALTMTATGTSYGYSCVSVPSWYEGGEPAWTTAAHRTNRLLAKVRNQERAALSAPFRGPLRGNVGAVRSALHATQRPRTFTVRHKGGQ